MSEKSLESGAALYRIKNPKPVAEQEFDEADMSSGLRRGRARYAAKRGNRSAAAALIVAAGAAGDNVSFGGDAA